MTAVAKKFSPLFDNQEAGNGRFVLETDEDGLLYETSNAVTRALVCGQMFKGWGHDYIAGENWLASLTVHFGGDKTIASRYVAAALDQDK